MIRVRACVRACVCVCVFGCRQEAAELDDEPVDVHVAWSVYDPHSTHWCYTSVPDARFALQLDALPPTPRRPATPVQLVELREEMHTLDEVLTALDEKLASDHATIETTQHALASHRAQLEGILATQEADASRLTAAAQEAVHTVLLEKNAFMGSKFLCVLRRNLFYPFDAAKSVATVVEETRFRNDPEVVLASLYQKTPDSLKVELVAESGEVHKWIAPTLEAAAALVAYLQGYFAAVEAARAAQQVVRRVTPQHNSIPPSALLPLLPFDLEVVHCRWFLIVFLFVHRRGCLGVMTHASGGEHGSRRRRYSLAFTTARRCLGRGLTRVAGTARRPGRGTGRPDAGV